MDKKKWLVGILLFVVMFISLIALGVSLGGCNDEDGGTPTITVGENPDLDDKDDKNIKIGTNWTNSDLGKKGYWETPYYTTGLLVITPEAVSFFSTCNSAQVSKKGLTLKNFNNGGMWGPNPDHPAGTSSLKWKASVSCAQYDGEWVNWLSLSTTEGTLASRESVLIEVFANPDDLFAFGPYTGTITFRSISDLNETYSIPVSLMLSYSPLQQATINFVEKHPVVAIAVLFAYLYYQDPGALRETLKEDANLRLSLYRTKQLLTGIKPKDLAINTQLLLGEVGAGSVNPLLLEKVYQNVVMTTLTVKKAGKLIQTNFSAEERKELFSALKAVKIDKLVVALGQINPQEPFAKLLQKYKIPYN